MKALIVEKDGSVALKEVDMPQYNEYQALVKIEATAVCGTDLKILHKEFNGFPDYPTILGHEAVGRVVEKGKKVKYLDIGDKVLHPILYDGVSGYHSTFGAMSEYAIIEDGRAWREDGHVLDEVTYHDHSRIQFKIPQEFDSVAATMLITFREVYSSIKRLGFKAGESLVIYGVGPVGQCFIKLCKMIGLKVAAVVRREERAQQALEAGADYIINSAKSVAAEEAKRLFPEGVDNVLDAVGVANIINEGLNMIKPFGKICVYGVTPETELLLNWKQAPLSFDVKFLQWPDKDSEIAVMGDIVNMMKGGMLNGMDYISDVVPFENAVEGIELFLARKNKKKIVFKL